MSFSNSSHRFGLVAALIIIAAVAIPFFMKKNTPNDTKQTSDVNSKVTAPSIPEAPRAETGTATAPIATTGAVFKTNLGDIEVAFFGADAPKTVENFQKLTKTGFYANTKFHRVIKDFMIQGGDPLSKDDAQGQRWGTGGPSYTFADEINSQKLVRGVLAMANAGPNTNGSQFFIVTAQATPWLDGKHTVFGKVVKGMDVVDKIGTTPTGENDVPKSPVIVESIVLK